MSPASFAQSVEPVRAHAPHEERTIWGLSPTQIHDRFWAARGVQVVRQGEPSEIVDDAELFLLTAPRVLAIFDLRRLLDRLSWLKPDLLQVRLRNHFERGYRELVVTDAQGRFVRFQRVYGGSDSRLARVGVTEDREIARLWQAATDTPSGWHFLRHRIRRRDRAAITLAGSVFDRGSDEEVAQFMRRLIELWKAPNATIHRVRRLSAGVWIDGKAGVEPSARFVGPSWVGAGRQVSATVVGPAVLWDDPVSRPAIDDLQWQEIEPTDVLSRPLHLRRLTSIERGAKRLFDIIAALVALTLTLPFYPLVMLAIWLEDGRPFFFAHQRETLRGKQFPCIKFRSMRKDAEQIKARYQLQNKADGPQFFIKNDPRLTRVGKVLRDLNIDELPQFINVLLGQMSLVGPRPSPFKENQYCPPWREARLSVRPGITGLWQVMRSRRQGLDFQEWIRYDIEYVEKVGWRLDLWIIWRTVLLLAFRPGKS